MDKKNTVSSAQKKAQKKYDQKTKMVSIKYTPNDMKDYEQLKKYLARTNQSMNGFIKHLIRKFFIEGQDKVERQVNDPVEKKRGQALTYYPFIHIDEENIQILFNLLGEKLACLFLDKYYDEILESNIIDILENKGCTFDEWIIDIKKQVISGEIDYDTPDQLYKIMSQRLCEEIY